MISSTILRRAGGSAAACARRKIADSSHRRLVSSSSRSLLLVKNTFLNHGHVVPKASTTVSFSTSSTSSTSRIPTTSEEQGQQKQSTTTTTIRSKSTQAQPAATKMHPSTTNPLSLWQKQCWETYLSTGRGSNTLFQAIDINHSRTINVQELHFFLDSVNRKGVHPRAFKMLDELTHDHKITFREFQAWLVVATKFGSDHKNSTFLQLYESSPSLGQRGTTVMRKKLKEKIQQDEQHEEEEYHSWNEMTMSQSVRRMQYAVRGKLVLKAEALQAQGRDILFTNVGNPHGVGQPAISYYRQVLALCDLPAENGVNNPNLHKLFPHDDIVERAKYYRDVCIGASGTGAYTGSQGILNFRQDVANYIQERDGGIHPAYPGNIFLTNGASSAIEFVMTTLIAGISDAIMIPIPQYPIYSGMLHLACVIMCVRDCGVSSSACLDSLFVCLFFWSRRADSVVCVCVCVFLLPPPICARSLQISSLAFPVVSHSSYMYYSIDREIRWKASWILLRRK